MTNAEVTNYQKSIGNREIEIKKRRIRELKILGNLVGATVWEGEESLSAVQKLQEKLHVQGVICPMDNNLIIVDKDTKRVARNGDLVGVTKSGQFIVLQF